VREELNAEKEDQMVYGKCLVVAFILLFVGFTVSSAEKAPNWILEGKSIKVSQISEDDYVYLARWLDENSKSPGQYLIDLFTKHQVVIYGEFHNVKEHKDLIIELIPRLYHQAGVRCIGWEFSKYIYNERLNRMVTASQFDRDDALQFARDQTAHEWNSKEHWDIIEAVWRLNNNLEPSQEKMRFIGLDKDVDFVRLMIVMKTKDEDSQESQEVIAEAIKRDKVMAEQVEKEIIEKGKKGLVFVGRGHDFTHYEFPPNINMGRPIMGNLLHKKYGDRVFHIWVDNRGFLAPIRKVMESRGHSKVGFSLYPSPFANILTSPGWNAPEVPLSQIAPGYVYLGPNLHANTPIKGFVTDEMFKKHRRYYEVDFGQTFNNAKEVDEYLQAHRWPKP
jgi:uncharacterized iron-regulated protein